MVRIRRWTTAAAMAALAAGIAVSSVLAADSAVTIANFAFDPGTVTIEVGDSVTWTNQDGAEHTATAADDSFDTGQIAEDESATVSFDTAGTFAYICSIHPQMTGSVVVEAAAATAAPTPRPTTGGGVTITPAPTDTVPTVFEDRASSAVTLALALLGVVMLVGSVVADRRFRAHG